MVERAPSEPDVFLSYAREDEARACELAEALEQRGISVFWDREVPPGQSWHRHIGEALAHAKCVIVAWSRHSLASQWVIEEANEGKDRNALVPVLFDSVPPPFGFRAIQAASLVDWRPGEPSPGFDGLLEAVQTIVAGHAGRETSVDAEASSASQPALAAPAPKTKPLVTPARPSLASSERRAWSRWMVAAVLAGFFAIVGGGAFLWRLNQSERIPVEPIGKTESSASEPMGSVAAVAIDQAAPEDPVWLQIAFRELAADIRERPGDDDNRPIVEYLKSLKSAKLPAKDEIPWDAAFVNWVMEQAGHAGTDSGQARSWLSWACPSPGQPVAALPFSRAGPTQASVTSDSI